MALWQPTRRELITTAPAALLAAAVPVSAQILPQSRPWRFFVVGDWGRDGEHFQQHVASWMAEKARRSGCNFVISTGDNFYTFGVSSVDDSQWKTSYENIYADWLRAKPWYPVAGNHDWGGNIWAQLDRSGRGGGWHMPWLWYDIRVDDVHLFFIDTVVWSSEETALYRYCGQAIRAQDVDDQKSWLKQALAASCASTKLVVGHHPLYSVGRHGRDANKQPGLDDLEQALLDNAVSAYICGHDHCLHHLRLQHRLPDGRVRELDQICSGGGSEELPEYHGGTKSGCVIREECGLSEYPKWYSFLGSAGFAIFEVGPHSLSFEFIDRNGNGPGKTTIPVRGQSESDCPGVPPIDPAVVQSRARARAKTWIPCAKFPKELVDTVKGVL